ncbi:MAG: DUF4349 domain-containing protein [Novosphingobium sp.]
MRKNTLIFATALASSIALAGCSKSDDSGPASPAPEAAEAQSGVTPNIAAGTAPGVAFNFDFSFVLPAKSISSIQQKHAEACAALGPARCRVTGITFDQVEQDEARGRTDFLLAPDLAFRFGNEGIAAVEKASGKLASAQVNGRDAGGEITLSQTDSAAIDAETRRIEARLAAKGLTSDERVELQRQLASLREKLRGNAQVRKDLEKSIATTPVAFNYSSEGLMDGGNTFGKAAGASWSSATTMLSMVTLLAGVALPWVLLVGLIVLLFRSPDLRRLLRRIIGGGAAPAPGE